MSKLRSVMIVDDDSEFLKETGRVFRNSGFNVIEHSSAEGVLEKAIEYRPDILLLDLKLRGTTGFELADTFRGCPDTVRIPILAITGHYTKSEHKLFVEMAGMNGVLKKPLDPEVLLEKVDEMITHN